MTSVFLSSSSVFRNLRQVLSVTLKFFSRLIVPKDDCFAKKELSDAKRKIKPCFLNCDDSVSHDSHVSKASDWKCFKSDTKTLHSFHFIYTYVLRRTLFKRAWKNVIFKDYLSAYLDGWSWTMNSLRKSTEFNHPSEEEKLYIHVYCHGQPSGKTSEAFSYQTRGLFSLLQYSFNSSWALNQARQT